MPKLLNHKWIVAIISLVVLVASFTLIGTFERELVATTDNGMIKFDIVTNLDSLLKREMKYIKSSKICKKTTRDRSLYTFK